MASKRQVLNRITRNVDRCDVLVAQRRDLVEAARAEGASWAEIGEALGTSKQGAMQRYRGERGMIDFSWVPRAYSNVQRSGAAQHEAEHAFGCDLLSILCASQYIDAWQPTLPISGQPRWLVRVEGATANVETVIDAMGLVLLSMVIDHTADADAVWGEHSLRIGTSTDLARVVEARAVIIRGETEQAAGRGQKGGTLGRRVSTGSDGQQPFQTVPEGVPAKRPAKAPAARRRAPGPRGTRKGHRP